MGSSSLKNDESICGLRVSGLVYFLSFLFYFKEYCQYVLCK